MRGMLNLSDWKRLFLGWRRTTWKFPLAFGVSNFRFRPSACCGLKALRYLFWPVCAISTAVIGKLALKGTFSPFKVRTVSFAHFVVAFRLTSTYGLSCRLIPNKGAYHPPFATCPEKSFAIVFYVTLSKALRVQHAIFSLIQFVRIAVNPKYWIRSSSKDSLERVRAIKANCFAGGLCFVVVYLEPIRVQVIFNQEIDEIC
ncbi:hypothetical protein amb3647 [Paramagnetospirillum magneticum AMB-1]|uniref:Uncharacterized protein n=1 Tax=Paramagnetospirillum magneticum (strain ATCC 700264 / AMB-1) TaxID=342108 RepID=Q2W124_PARM1|nr:hypothetical protein amb3647 [Paramagnetospirillum magneticum AMB-1]